MFKGENLTNLRILNNMSRKDLANEIGVTEQAIWQYEKNYVSPKLAVINKLKTLFHVKSTYFLEEDFLSWYPEVSHVENIAYRSDSINTLNKTQSETMHVRFMDAFLKTIEQKIIYPTNIIKEIRDEAVDLISKNNDSDRNKQIKLIATLARQRIGIPIDSNNNLLFHLEKAGIFIYEKYIGDDIDAYSLWTDDDRAYIILGTIRETAVRRNFDLAHELGHLLLHVTHEFNMQDTESNKILEKEANLFAGEFLLPEEQFIEECASIAKKSNPDAYVDLKRKWEVSLQAIAIRAFQLRLISYQQYRYFYMLINKHNYKQMEPLDNEIPIKKPAKVKTILQLIFEKNFYIDSL